MKTKPYPKGRWDNLICALLISLHFTVILCRPPSHGRNFKSIPNFNPSISSTQERAAPIHHHHHHASHSKHSEDLKTDNSMAKFGDRDAKAANFLPSSTDLSDVSPSRDSSAGSDLNEVLFENADSFQVDDHYESAGGSHLTQGAGVFSDHPEDDVTGDAIGGPREGEYTTLERRLRTSSVMDKKEVVTPLIDESIPKRNLNRKRRQPLDMQKGTHRWRRKRRRRHRLLLRTRNYLNNPREAPRGRDRFILKSDGPGQVIFGADEVKKDWCRTIPFNQTVTASRCKAKVIKNNLCYGQCNSFFIPQSERTSNKVAFQSCANCKPQRLRWVNVTLSCPGQSPPKMQMTILKVESCRCIASDRTEVDESSEYLRRKTKSSYAGH
ncbi:gremlin-2 [Trichonephila clavipes]|nr:gremlin-2 [Trichonephila clavipes]